MGLHLYVFRETGGETKDLLLNVNKHSPNLIARSEHYKMDSLSERFKTLHVTLETDLNPMDRNVHAERLPLSVVRK